MNLFQCIFVRISCLSGRLLSMCREEKAFCANLSQFLPLKSLFFVWIITIQLSWKFANQFSVKVKAHPVCFTIIVTSCSCSTMAYFVVEKGLSAPINSDYLSIINEVKLRLRPVVQFVSLHSQCSETASFYFILSAVQLLAVEQDP